MLLSIRPAPLLPLCVNKAALYEGHTVSVSLRLSGVRVAESPEERSRNKEGN